VTVLCPLQTPRQTRALTWKLNSVFSSWMSGCPGAEAFSGLMAAKVRWPPNLAASSRVITPFSPMAKAMVGAAGAHTHMHTRALAHARTQVCWCHCEVGSQLACVSRPPCTGEAGRAGVKKAPAAGLNVQGRQRLGAMAAWECWPQARRQLFCTMASMLHLLRDTKNGCVCMCTRTHTASP